MVDGTNGQVLSTDGNGVAYWGTISAGSLTLDGLSDVIITSPSTGQILRYGIPVGSGEVNPVWHNVTPNYLTTSSSIDALNDVVITTAAAGQILQYNGSNWVNATLSTVEYVSKVQHIIKAGVAITKGQAVYITGSDGTNMIAGLASNTSEGASSKVMGLAASTAAINAQIFVVTEGLLTGLNTSTATAGDPVWLGANGNLIFGLLNKPTSPAHLVYLGVVTRVQSNNGEIFVKVQNGIEIDEIHDVQISSPATGQLLRRDTDGYWKNWTPNYLTTETDPTVPSYVKTISTTDISNWNTGYNDSIRGISFNTSTGVLTLTQQDSGTLTVDLDGRYLESFTETDPTVPSHVKNITATNISNWNDASNDSIRSASFDTANGVLTLTQVDLGTVTVDLDGRYITSETDSQTLTWTKATSSLTISNGNSVTLEGLATEEYVTSQGYLTSLPAHNHDSRYYTETESDSRFYLATNPNGYITSSGNTSGYSGSLLSDDNRTISPSEAGASQLRFGFTSWTNNNASPWADYLHLRSYSDSSGGSDNLVMFKKTGGIGMRIWQQTWGSATAYSSYVDVWTTGDFSSTDVSNWNTAYGWGDHAEAGYLTDFSYSETDTLSSVTSRGGSTGSPVVMYGKVTLGNNSSGTYSGNTTGLTLNSTAEVRSTGVQNPPALTWHYEGLATRHLLMTSTGAMNFVSPSNEAVGVAVLQVNGNTVWHGGNLTNNSADWNAAYDWGNHAVAGYLTSLPAHNHDDRYYTETESDSRYVNASGDTMSGNLTLSGYTNPHITLTTTGGNYSYLELYDGSSYGYVIKNQTSSTSNGVLPGSLYLYTDSSKATQIVHNGTSNAAFLSGGDVYIRGQVYVGGNGASTGTQLVYNSGTWGINITGSAGSATTSSSTYRGIIEDTRAAQRTPNDYDDYRVSWEFTNQIPGLSGNTSWWSVMTMQGWHNGYSAWQIIGSSSSAIDDFYLRAGNNTTWNTACRIWHSGDFTSTNVSNWNTAYNDRISSAAVTGTTTKTLTLTQGDGGTVTATWTDYDTDNDAQQLTWDKPSTTLSISNGNSVALEGLATEEFVTGQGYVTGSYLPLTGGTLSGAVIVNLGNVTSDTVAFKVGGPSNYDSLTIGMEDSPDYDAFIASFGNDIRFYSGKGVGTEDHSFHWYTSKAGTAQHSVVAMRLDHNQNLTIGGTFTEQSSIRYKENVKSIPSVSQKVEHLDAVSYNKIGGNQEEIGLIAEDVAELFPEVVKYDNEGRPDGINYSRLSVILLKAVQELTERVNKLENK